MESDGVDFVPVSSCACGASGSPLVAADAFLTRPYPLSLLRLPLALALLISRLSLI